MISEISEPDQITRLFVCIRVEGAPKGNSYVKTLRGWYFPPIGSDVQCGFVTSEVCEVRWVPSRGIVWVHLNDLAAKSETIFDHVDALVCQGWEGYSEELHSG